MTNKNISDIYNLIQELSWHFGNHGFNGECCGDLTLVEFMALKRAYQNPNLSVHELGNALNLTKSGATRLVDRLENKGYVTREQSPKDGRICCITPTIQSNEVIKNIMDKYTAYLGEILEDLDRENLDNIEYSLGILVELIQQKGLQIRL